MPKPHYNNNAGPAWARDDREFRGGGNRDRRVTFKQNRQGGKHPNKDWSTAIREHLQDEDIDMGANVGRKNQNRKHNNKNKNKRGSSPMLNRPRKLLVAPNNWYRVAIPFGDKYEKSFLMKTIHEKLSPLNFWPIAWQTFSSTVVFFIDDLKVAEKLFSLDRQIQLPNGFKLVLKVLPGTPNVDLSKEAKEKIKLAMAKRYNAATKALDLTKFHADPDLQDMFCALFKPMIFLNVLEIIEENIPDLEALNLFDNGIFTLTGKKLNKALPNLKIFHLGNNKIKNMIVFNVCSGLPVVDLMLHGNPLCDQYKDKEAYISDVRKRFPKCVKLDGVDLPPPISFDISEEAHLPDPQQTFLCNSEGESIVRQFLEQYFLIFDTENRQPLLQAYHENAVFSMTVAYPYGLGSKEKNVSWLNWYHTDNRNLMRVQDLERRAKLLKQGQLAVVSFLQDMPQTKHDIHSFTVDLTLFTPQMICLTVSGIFKESKSGHKFPPVRFFFRTLVIVPAGSGFCIANEVLHVTNATPDQAKGAFKTPIAIPVATTSAAPIVASPVQGATPIAPDDAMKEEMVKQLSLKSGMNLEWSMKCLAETQWDFYRATMVFEQLQRQGVIPPEAFVK